MPSSNFRFLSQGVAAATQNRHLPFTPARLPATPGTVLTGPAPALHPPLGVGGMPDIGAALVLDLPPAPAATPRAAAAPMDSRNILRVVRMILYLRIRGNLAQL